jgi:aspartate kinase
MRVFKFGGASVKNPEALKNVANILQAYKGEPLAIVVSAMGKTTNALEEVVAAYTNKTGEAFERLNAVREQHFAIMRELFEPENEVFASVNDSFVEVEWVIEDELHDAFDYVYDQIVSIGEMVSTKIVAAYLNKVGLPTTWLDIRNVILTDDTYREGIVQWKETVLRANEQIPPLLAKGGFVLTQGFIGVTADNHTTTLGREGSDYTAAILSYCLDAEAMAIWKDVPGVLTADPRLFKNVTKLDRLSYKEAIEMTYYGANVIHPKTIKPLQNKQIPLLVKSFIEPSGSGTIIADSVEAKYPPIIVVEQRQILLHISTRDFSFVAAHHLSDLFRQFAKYRIKINMMQNTAISFTVCVTNATDRLPALLEALDENYNVATDNDLELVTVRYYRNDLVKSLKKGKIVLFEERIRNTIQLVLKDAPNMKRIKKGG